MKNKFILAATAVATMLFGASLTVCAADYAYSFTPNTTAQEAGYYDAMFPLNLGISTVENAEGVTEAVTISGIPQEVKKGSEGEDLHLYVNVYTVAEDGTILSDEYFGGDGVTAPAAFTANVPAGTVYVSFESESLYNGCVSINNGVVADAHEYEDGDTVIAPIGEVPVAAEEVEAVAETEEVAAVAEEVVEAIVEAVAEEIAEPVADVADGTYTVVKGDNLSKIAKKFYGDANKWRLIYEANKSQIKNPNIIHIGQVFVIPGVEATAEVAAPVEETVEEAAPVEAVEEVVEEAAPVEAVEEVAPVDAATETAPVDAATETAPVEAVEEVVEEATPVETTTDIVVVE